MWLDSGEDADGGEQEAFASPNPLWIKSQAAKYSSEKMHEYSVRFLEEMIAEDGSWSGRFQFGLKVVEVRLKETVAELALRMGKAPESVNSFGKGGQRKRAKSHRTAAGDTPLSEGDDSHRTAEESAQYEQALKQTKVVYVVEGEEMSVLRQDRRTGGAGYRTARAPLKEEAQVAVELWQKKWICSRAVPRIAPEQRTCIDDVLGSMVEPHDLLCDSKEKHSYERFKKNIPRKYTCYVELGQEVETLPSVFVKETWAKEEAPDQEYEKRKHYLALKPLMMELKRRVLAGELLLSAGRNYWRSKIVGPREKLLASRRCMFMRSWVSFIR